MESVAVPTDHIHASEVMVACRLNIRTASKRELGYNRNRRI
jgi:hypothetical protein